MCGCVVESVGMVGWVAVDVRRRVVVSHVMISSGRGMGSRCMWLCMCQYVRMHLCLSVSSVVHMMITSSFVVRCALCPYQIWPSIDRDY